MSEPERVPEDVYQEADSRPQLCSERIGGQRMDCQFRHGYAKVFALILAAAGAHACSSSEAGIGFPAGGKCTQSQDCASHVCSAGTCQGGPSSNGGASGSPTGSLPGSACSQASDCLSGKGTSGPWESAGS